MYALLPGGCVRLLVLLPQHRFGDGRVEPVMKTKIPETPTREISRMDMRTEREMDMRKGHRPKVRRVLASLCAVMVLAGQPAWAQLVENKPASLKTVPTPEPPNLNQFLKTNGKGISPGARAAAIALGKALFWDQAVGSDGQACASCHYNAGADSRTKNQVDPGLRAIPPQGVFGAMPPQQTTGVAAPFTQDYQLKASDFPLTQFITPGVRASGIASDTQAVVSSQGVVNSTFGDITPSLCPADQTYLNLATVKLCDKSNLDTGGNGAIFGAANHVRNVEPRNTPTVINAVFNFRNFFDSRGRNEFNGVNPIGDLDPYARVLLASGSGNSAKLQKIALSGSLRLEDASLASQAVGPALSDMEMSAQQRSFAKLGKKMLALPFALPAQLVAPDDSVLGNNTAASVKSSYPLPGINKAYADLIQAAFQPQWYGSNMMIEFTGSNDTDGTVGLKISKPTKALTTNQFTQMEFNFSLFWGIAIQMYEATLVANDSAFDQAFDSGNPLTFVSPKWGDLEKAGWKAFQGAGRCINCHGGPELTNASVRNVRLIDGKTEIMTMGDLGVATYDVGSYNTAVRRCLDQKAGPAPCDDGGIGVTIGPLNLPLSFARFSQMVATHDPTNPSDPITIVCKNQPEACNVPFLSANSRVAVDGAFKTPGLRNIELQAPYMHNGGELGLMDIVDFYDRGGNFPEYNIQNLDPDIGNIQRDPGTGQLVFLELSLSDAEKDALVAFMKALTDERVRGQRAPFDHPQLFLPNLPPDPNCPACKSGELPAVGRNGVSTYEISTGRSFPLPTFFDNLAP
jgi:cytochrome c peroxidase